ncbi:phospholipase-like protein [Tanacetum coccineum]
MRNDEISPFDLANAGIDLNQPLEEEVMVTGSCATDEYLSFYNVDPAKVVRGQYVDCMNINAPDMYIGFDISRVIQMEFTVLARSTNQLLDGVDYSELGMLDGSSRPLTYMDDVDIVYMPLHCNGNHWVTCVVNLPSSTIHVIDSLPNDDRYHTLKAHLSKWTSLLNVMLLKDGHPKNTTATIQFQVSIQ